VAQKSRVWPASVSNYTDWLIPLIANPLSLAAEETRLSRRSRAPYWGLAAIFLAVYVGSMFTPALLDDADATHAEAAREMFVSGDYVTLHVNGVRYLEKAPLPYWLVAFSYKILGVNEFSTRLPMVLAVMLLGLLAFWWGQRAFGERVGVYATLFLYTCAGVYLFTRILIPEVLLSLLIGAALYFFLTAQEPGAAPWRCYAFYALMALGVLTKGLIALVFPCGTAFFFLFITGEWRRWREFRLFSGFCLFLAIAAPWHILAGLRNPGTAGHHGFFWFYFVNEHFLRFLGKRIPHDYNKLPAALYWSLHLVWLFPWSFYLPAAIRTAIDSRRWQSSSPVMWTGSRTDFASRTRLLCWLWAGVVLIFFSISTNQEYYTFPAYLPLLLLLADGVEHCEWKSSQNSPLQHETKTGFLRASAAALAAIGIAASLALALGLWRSRNLPFEPDIGRLLTQQALGAYTLSTSHMLDLSYASFAALRLPAALAAVVLLLFPLLSFLLRLRRRHYTATWVLGAGFAVFLIAAHIALVRFGPYLSSRQLAHDIAAQARPDDKVMIYGDQAFGSSLLFYLRRPIYLVEGRTTSMWFGSTFPDAPRIFLSDADLVRAWGSDQRVFLFVPDYKKSRVDQLLPHKFVVAELSDKYVYSNHP
jgi:4-amino-4-deoxy-L-arabinose transferase-like glycosyltransferase